MMYKLSDDELRYIGTREEMLRDSLNRIEKAKKFKFNDYLVAYDAVALREEVKVPILNSYGVVKKFQVVAIDDLGIAYLKELNKNGKPFGPLIDILSNTLSMEFDVDPDYTDAIIFDDTDKFDASNLHREKANLHKEITEFNKKHRVQIKKHKQLIEFLLTCKIGDTLWRSNATSWTILEINPVPRKGNNSIDWFTPFMKVQTNKGRILDLSYTDISGKALYTMQPRTYRELKNPI